MGDILSAVEWAVEKSCGYVEPDVLRGALERVLPHSGIVISASIDELKGNENLSSLMFKEIEIKSKEGI